MAIDDEHPPTAPVSTQTPRAQTCPYLSQLVETPHKRTWEVYDSDLVQSLLTDRRVISKPTPPGPDAPKQIQDVGRFVAKWPIYAPTSLHSDNRQAIRDFLRKTAMGPARQQIYEFGSNASGEAKATDNIVDTIARRTALHSLGLLFEIDQSEIRRLMKWSDTVMHVIMTRATALEDHSAAADTILQASVWLKESYLPRNTKLGLALSRTPTDDFELILAMFFQLLTGAVEPLTTALISIVLTSIRENEQEPFRAAELGLLAGAPFGYVPRRMAEEIPEVSNQSRQGDHIRIMIGAANQQRLDRYKTQNERTLPRNLAFGLGEHYCLGAAFARLHLEETFRATRDSGLLLRVDVQSLKVDDRPGGPSYSHLGLN